MTIEFEHELEIEGHVLKVFVEAEGNVWDEKWGQDADGNRGVWKTFCEVEKLTVKDGRGNDISDKLYEKHLHPWEDIDEKATEKLVEAFEGES